MLKAEPIPKVHVIVLVDPELELLGVDTVPILRGTERIAHNRLFPEGNTIETKTGRGIRLGDLRRFKDGLKSRAKSPGRDVHLRVVLAEG